MRFLIAIDSNNFQKTPFASNKNELISKRVNILIYACCVSRDANPLRVFSPLHQPPYHPQGGRDAPPRGSPRTQSLAKLGCRYRGRSRSGQALPKAEAPFVSWSDRTEETHARAKPGAVPPWPP